jgi:Glycosyl transferases group 1
MGVSAIDIAEKPTDTNCWWFLFRALSEMGHEIIVVPFLGRPVSSPWWRSLDNPSRTVSSILYSGWRGAAGSKRAKSFYAKHHGIIQYVPRLITSRRWKSSVDKAAAEYGPIDAAMFFSVPLNLLDNVPAHLREEWDVPSVFYEADMPSILPSYQGIHFSYYYDADLSQFDGFLSDSEGVKETLAKMGAKNVATLHWAADPQLMAPMDVKKDTDVFFQGGTSAFREEWMDKMIREPSEQMPTTSFVMSGRMKERYGNVKNLGYLNLSSLRQQVSRSRICLSISRGPHAAVDGTSSTRFFELASMGACIVSNPHKGLEKWFKPDEEIIILDNGASPIEVYRRLLHSPELTEQMGARARARILAEHTYKHRAQQLDHYLRELI